MTEQFQMNFEGIITPPSPSYLKRGLGGVTQINDDLTYEEQLLLGLLKPGKENANSVKWLAGMLKMEEVTLRERIRHLIMEHGVCIGSSTSKCPGYYLITQPEELDKNYVSLRRRGIKILMRAAELKRISLEEVFQQGRMEFS